MSFPCNRCRTGNALANDTYCLACAAWEGLGRDLQAPWGTTGCRDIATELIVACARNLRALRNVSHTLGSGAGTSPGIKEEPKQESKPAEGKAAERPALQRRRSEAESKGTSAKASPHTAREGRKRERTDTDSSDDTEEEEVTEATIEPLGGRNHPKPPEPDGPPPGGHRSERHSDRTKDHHHRRDHPWRREREKKHRPGHRAGRKHQRVARTASDPFKRIHRKLPHSFFEERLSDRGRAALED